MTTPAERLKEAGLLTEIHIPLPWSGPEPCHCLWPFPTNCRTTCDGRAIGPRIGWEEAWER